MLDRAVPHQEHLDPTVWQHERSLRITGHEQRGSSS